ISLPGCGALPDKIHVVAGVKRQQLVVRRIAGIHYAGALIESPGLEFTQECRQPVRSERMAVAETVASQPLAHDDAEVAVSHREKPSTAACRNHRQARSSPP